jgi:hypothetical protein
LREVLLGLCFKDCADRNDLIVTPVDSRIVGSRGDSVGVLEAVPLAQFFSVDPELAGP